MLVPGVSAFLRFRREGWVGDDPDDDVFTAGTTIAGLLHEARAALGVPAVTQGDLNASVALGAVHPEPEDIHAPPDRVGLMRSGLPFLVPEAEFGHGYLVELRHALAVAALRHRTVRALPPADLGDGDPETLSDFLLSEAGC